MSPVVNITRYGNCNIVVSSQMSKKRVSTMTEDFLSTAHDHEELYQIASLEIDLSDEDFLDDCNIERQLKLNRERLSMITTSFVSAKVHSEVLHKIKRQVNEKRLSMTTADFLSTNHDPEVLRKIASLEVDMSNDVFLDDENTQKELSDGRLSIMTADSLEVMSNISDPSNNNSLYCPGLELSDVWDDDYEYFWDDDEKFDVCQKTDRKSKIHHYYGKIRIHVKDVATIGLPFTTRFCCKLLWIVLATLP